MRRRNSLQTKALIGNGQGFFHFNQPQTDQHHLPFSSSERGTADRLRYSGIAAGEDAPQSVM
jgi:hypothetical protein